MTDARLQAIRTRVEHGICEPEDSADLLAEVDRLRAVIRDNTGKAVKIAPSGGITKDDDPLNLVIVPGECYIALRAAAGGDA